MIRNIVATMALLALGLIAEPAVAQKAGAQPDLSTVAAAQADTVRALVAEFTDFLGQRPGPVPDPLHLRMDRELGSGAPPDIPLVLMFGLKEGPPPPGAREWMVSVGEVPRHATRAFWNRLRAEWDLVFFDQRGRARREGPLQPESWWRLTPYDPTAAVEVKQPSQLKVAR
jgi:hypothetical protein